MMGVPHAKQRCSQCPHTPGGPSRVAVPKGESAPKAALGGLGRVTRLIPRWMVPPAWVVEPGYPLIPGRM